LLDTICSLLFRLQIWSILLPEKQFAAAAAIFLLFDGGNLCRWGCNEFQQKANWSIIMKNCYLMLLAYRFRRSYSSTFNTASINTKLI
jgi:hypothetical protein